MARRAYKRRSTRKSTRRSKKRRYARRYKKKSRTSTGKLWKYVKKATKSEVKRCDINYPPNSTYTNENPTTGNYQLFTRENRVLFQMIFKNNGTTTSSNFSLYKPWTYDGVWRFWYPYQLEFKIDKGTNSNQRVGDKIFAKYINFKIHFYTKYQNDWPHFTSLYFVEVKRSVSGTYSPDNIIQAIWDGVANFCRDGHAVEIYDPSISAGTYTTYRTLMAQSYCQKRKKYLKGIRIRKLHSSHSNLTAQAFPSYQDTGVAQFNEVGTTSSSTYTGTITASSDVAKRLEFWPASAHQVLLAQPRICNNFKSKLVTINREWKYAVNNSETTDQVLDEYKYYLIALCSDYQLGTTDFDAKYYVSGELVFTDK